MEKHHGDIIKAFMKKKRYSQTYVAGKLHKSRQAVAKMLDRDNIDIKTLQKLSDVLKHDFLKDILGIKDNTQDENMQVEERRMEYASASTRNKTTMKLVIDIDPDDPEGISIDFISKLNDMLRQYVDSKQTDNA